MAKRRHLRSTSDPDYDLMLRVLLALAIVNHRDWHPDDQVHVMEITDALTGISLEEIVRRRLAREAA